MVAERLAKAVGLDYAVMSGGDVVPLGKHAVSELHRLFDWAAASPRGLLLLVDEADAFLRHRDSAGMSEVMRSALNALLVRARGVTPPKSSRGDAEGSLGDAESSLGDAKSSRGDTRSSQWVTLRARWVTLRARGVKLRALAG
jgi:hypothetical protein